MRPAPALLLAASLALLGCGGMTVEEIPSLAAKAKEGDQASLRALVKASASADHDLSLAAYQALLAAGERSLPALLEGLEAADPALFEAAAAGAANLRARPAVPLLLAALGEGRERAIPAAWALGMIGDPAAIGPLAGALAAPHPDLRKAVVRALVRMGSATEGAVIAAWKAHPGDPGAERAAIRVLGEIRSRAAVPLLLAAGEGNRDAAVWALGRIHDKSAAASVLASLGDPRWQVRREAAQALATLGDRSVEPALRRALDDPEFVVREWAARSLMTVTGEEVLYRDEQGKMTPPYNLYH